MDNDGWVTDPNALHTIIFAKMIQPGDMLRLRRCREYGIYPEPEDSTAVIEPDSRVWDVGRFPKIAESGLSTPVARIENGCVVTSWNIAAWRRPSALKK